MLENENLKNDIIDVLNCLRNEVKIDMLSLVRYDVKDEWIESFDRLRYLENAIFNTEHDDIKNSYEKMLLYKRFNSSLQIDCDVSLRSSCIYALAFDYIHNSNASARRKLSLQQSYNNSKQKYTFSNGVDFEFRGDTMNSFKQITDMYLTYIIKDITKDTTVFQFVNDYVKINHTLGNFMPVPFGSRYNSFNIARNSKVGDFFDLTLYYIYSWYIKGDDIYISKLVGENEDILDTTKKWLSYFGSKINGWKEFISKNYLEAFVNKDKEDWFPKEFWDKHFSTHFESSKSSPTSLEDFTSFFKIVPTVIEERGNDIALRLKEILNKYTNDEILEKYFFGDV